MSSEGNGVQREVIEYHLVIVEERFFQALNQ